MMSIFNQRSGKLLRNVASLDGENMRGRGSAPCPPGWERMRWDATARSWVADAGVAAEVDARRVDEAYRAEFGDGAKREAHMRKAMEARLYLRFGAPELAPMLAHEARATGVALGDLAAAVIAKDNEWIEREVARRSAKLKGKSDA
ncbi:hypothetical protein [uncultured Sphingopyxis sp.]|uniref:hypothetical protein n=1 Tax=uncultured Sphingopyxis sp. TaxID=310581 RepID=UPI000A4C5044|nr:hypothetical protein [uncultured Sphingopyxis sp.]